MKDEDWILGTQRPPRTCPRSGRCQKPAMPGSPWDLNPSVEQACVPSRQLGTAGAVQTPVPRSGWRAAAWESLVSWWALTEPPLASASIGGGLTGDAWGREEGLEGGLGLLMVIENRK